MCTTGLLNVKCRCSITPTTCTTCLKKCVLRGCLLQYVVLTVANTTQCPPSHNIAYQGAKLQSYLSKMWILKLPTGMPCRKQLYDKFLSNFFLWDCKKMCFQPFDYYSYWTVHQLQFAHGNPNEKKWTTAWYAVPNHHHLRIDEYGAKNKAAVRWSCHTVSLWTSKWTVKRAVNIIRGVRNDIMKCVAFLSITMLVTTMILNINGSNTYSDFFLVIQKYFL